MSTDAELIERLRRWVACPNPYDTAQEAADRLATLVAERDKLKEALDKIQDANDRNTDVEVANEIDLILAEGWPATEDCAFAALSPTQEDLVQPAAVLADGQCDHPVSEWLPIETAPQDGTPILIYDARTESMRWAVWAGDLWRDGTVEARGTMVGCQCPTHWMPLPASPPVSEDGA